MIDAISHIENSLFKKVEMKISDLKKDEECEEYGGFNFQILQHKIKFRKAKITPKKNGQFVTLWRRNTAGKTEPFTAGEDFDFCLIATVEKNAFGFFFFPKNILAEKHILTHHHKEGKRGFRVYADWDIPQSKQAESTKNWQTKYFINLSSGEEQNIKKFNLILHQNHFSEAERLKT